MKYLSSIIVILISVVLFTPQNANASYYSSGRTYFVYKNYKKAREMFLKAVERYEYGDAYYFLGEIEKIEKNYDKATEYFKKAIELRTTKKYKKNAYWNLIVLAEQKGDMKEVVRICKHMWDHTRDSSARSKIESMINKYQWTNNQQAIAAYKAGISLRNRRKIEKAKEKFLEATRLEENFLAPRLELGIMAYKANNLSEAAEYLQEVTDKIPFFGEAQLIMGDIQYRRREYQSAIKHLTMGLDFGFTSTSRKYYILLKRGKSYYRSGDYEKSLLDITKANRIRRSFNNYLFKSTIEIKLKKYDDAIKTLKKARSYKKNNPDVLYRLGSLYYKKNDSRYTAYFDLLFSITEKKDKYRKAFIILAKKHYEKGNYTRSLKILSTVSDTDSAELSRIKARIQYRKKNYDKVIDILDSISLDTEDKILLARACYWAKRKDRATTLVKELSAYEENRKKLKKYKYLYRIYKKIQAEEEKKRKERDKDTTD